MYIVCNKCNDFLSFAKTMGDGWYSNFISGDDFNEFFDKHNPHLRKLEDGLGTKQYTLVTEVEDPKVKLYDFKRRKILLT